MNDLLISIIQQQIFKLKNQLKSNEISIEEFNQEVLTLFYSILRIEEPLSFQTKQNIVKNKIISIKTKAFEKIFSLLYSGQSNHPSTLDHFKEHISSNQKGILLKTISDLFHCKHDGDAIYFLYHIMSNNELIAAIPKIDNPIVLDLIRGTSMRELQNRIMALHYTYMITDSIQDAADKQQHIDSYLKETLSIFDKSIRIFSNDDINDLIRHCLTHDNLEFFKHLFQNNLISPDPIEINNSTKALILHAISYKAHNIIYYMMSFPENFLSSDMNDIALEFLEHYPHHPWAINVFESMIQNDQFFLEALFILIEQQWLNLCPEKKNGYLRIVELISKYANPQKLNLAKDFAYNSKKIKPLAYYLDQKINYQSHYLQRFDFDIEILIKNGAKLDDKTVDGNETNCLALCESHLPDMLETINRIQFEYAHDSRWQKLLDMGALTKDVDLYIYDLVCQNPQLIVENQILKTLFCQILSQENRPHIDSIWEAYHSNIVQHLLTHIIQNFLVKRGSKMTPHDAPKANIMQDPLSFTTGYCHYLGKDVLFILDNNLDERKSLLTTKLYQSEIKPYLLPKSINHSLFSQLCQHKNVSDLGQHRFDQRYGVMVSPDKYM